MGSIRKTKLVNTFGIGMLIGTVFLVIIPEGIESTYAQLETETLVKINSKIDQPSLIRDSFSIPNEDDNVNINSEDAIMHHDHHDHHDHHGNHGNHGHHGHHGQCKLPDATKYIGASLVLGFASMLVIDRFFSGGGHGHSHGLPSGIQVHSHGYPYTNVSIKKLKKLHDEGDHDSTSEKHERKKNANTTAAIGLLVHAAVDGIALGAISVSDNDTLEAVVFFAIMMHKAPAAFGITSFLLQEGKSFHEIRLKLLAFSLCAPLMAVVTFVILVELQVMYGTSMGPSSNMIGLCLLFSGGTFLYT